MKRHVSRPFALFVAILITAPFALFITPQTVRAQGVPTNEVPFSKVTLESTISAIKNTLTAIQTHTSAVANVAMQVNAYVLQPLAFVLSGNLLKAITSGTIAFVIGEANGTGVPQFVQNVRGNMQTVGDIQASAFLVQFGRNSNSPFASAISSSLRSRYLQNTSLAGFWAANKCTLSGASNDVNRFLAGDWSQGGAGAWFALTTQDQNNPYTLYQNSQSKLASLIGRAESARSAELDWGQGMLSWCGEGDSTTLPSEADGVTVGDPCEDEDGNPGIIKTPGSVISASLNEALGYTAKKLIEMGSVANEVNKIFGDVATVMNTVNFATQLLGGSESGGLSGSGSRVAQYRDAPGFLGISQSQIEQDSAGLLSTTDTVNNQLTGVVANDLIDRMVQYQSAWNAIAAAANTASTSVHSLISYCAAERQKAQTSFENYMPAIITTFIAANSAVIASAQTVLAREILPAFAQVASANAIIASSTAAQEALRTATSSVNTTTQQEERPTIAETSSAQKESHANGTETATPGGSLNISSGTMFGRLNLITANAGALKRSCEFQPVLNIYYSSLDAPGGDH